MIVTGLHKGVQTKMVLDEYCYSCLHGETYEEIRPLTKAKVIWDSRKRKMKRENTQTL
jgi:hypothetical protein